MKLTKEKRDHLILTGIGTVAVISGLWFGFISGQKSKIVGLDTQISETETKLGKAKTAVSYHESVLKEVEELKARLQKKEETFVSSTDIYASTVQAVNQVRQKHPAVVIKDHTRPVEEKFNLLPDFPYRAAVFTVMGEAFYHDFGRFLADFENQLPHMRLQRLKLTPGTASLTPIPEKLTFEMEVITVINKPSS